MHVEAMLWVAEHATTDPVTVLDIGGRNVNGTPRPLFPNAVAYTVLDVRPGPGVDIVADAATWNPHGRRWDVVVCCEVFEHTGSWPQILQTAYRALRPGGRLIVTTASPERAVHSGVDGGPLLHPGEEYAGIDPVQLRLTLEEAGFAGIVVDVLAASADVRAVASRPG
jgi:SAM-dependent methyltransferase